VFRKKPIAAKPTLKDEHRRPVECSKHGHRYATFVCKHLVAGHGLGFFTPDPDRVVNAEDSTDRQAWCAACDKIREAQGGWDGVSEGAAEITMICDACFEAARIRNSRDEHHTGTN